MKISLLKGKFDNKPVTQDLTWEQLIELLRKNDPIKCPTITHRVEVTDEGAKKKIEIPADRCPSLTRDPLTGKRLPFKCGAREIDGWSPSVFEGGRKAENVVSADVLCFDIDHTTMAQAEAIDQRIEAEGFAAILHSSHSHDPDRDDVCLRLVLQAERTMTPPEILATRAYLERLLGLPTDPSTKDLNRLYYMPTRPALGPSPIFGVQPGRAVPVQAPTLAGGLLSQIGDARGSPVAPVAPSGAQVFPGRTNGDIPALLSELTKIRSKTDELRRMLAGEPMADVGHRDAAMQRLAGFVAWRLADASIEAMVELGRLSCAAMDPEKDLDKWREKLTRACERKAMADEDQRARQEAVTNTYGMIAARAHPEPDGTENPNAFSDAKVEAWALNHGCQSIAEFQQQWVIRHHGANWVFCNGRYGLCVPDNDIDYTVRRDLGRAPVVLMKPGKTGDLIQRPMKEILLEYATVARSVTASLSLRESRYDHQTETFHEAVCPIRPLKPREWPEINEWLTLFGGDVLLDWVACVSMLDKPAAALYIEGPPGTGKNVLADGLARLWHKGGASAFKDVIGSNFNDSLIRCPLIHADEGIPKTDTIIDDLRRLIGSNSCPLNRKFMPVVSLEGCPRLIITANNDRVLLDTGAHLGPHDIDAITQRIRQVKAGKPAAEYLAGIRELKGRGYIESWVKDDKVAEHALWLAENRKVDDRQRFLVAGKDAGQAEAMTTGTGQVGAIMEFLARFLSDNTAMKTPKVRYGSGKLAVNTELMADKHTWERYVPSRKIPSARYISDSLRAVSTGTISADGMEFFEVKPHMLINWSRTNQVGSAAIIEGKINA